MNTDLDDLPPVPPAPPARALTVAAAPTAPPSAEPAADASFNAPQRVCPNCGAPVHGPFCYACGQSEKGMVRHLSEVFSDLGDIIFNVDSRIFRSVFDLYFRPGYLTNEYIAGRRARYVSPFRLFFFLSIVAFFAMQTVFDGSGFDLVMQNTIGDAASVAEVDTRVESQIASLRTAQNAVGVPSEAQAELKKAEAEVRAEGDKRKRYLEKKAAAKDNPSVATTVEDTTETSGLTRDDDGNLTWNGVRISSTTNPLDVGWLPDAANAKLNATFDHMLENIRSINEKPSRAIVGFMSVLPQTLFVLMPLFAVLLKFFYMFKRRLYMEHLLVALHSHAFIFLSLILIIMLGTIEGWAGPRIWITAPLAWLKGFAWIWLFAYLFWMQKRVYAQGWIMTTIKFAVIGNCYTFLLTFGVVLAAIVSLAVT